MGRSKSMKAQPKLADRQRITRGAGVHLPHREPVEGVSVGVQAGMPGTGAVDRPKARQVSAAQAAEMCSLFPAGGSAFTRWLEKAGHPMDAQSLVAWEPLLREFANRPIHGHRRSAE